MRVDLMRQSTAILYYHSISRSGRFAISPETFTLQVRYLRDHFDIVRLKDIANGRTQQQRSTPRVVITFDDAYTDFLENAYPVLSRLRVPATVFVPTAFIGRTNEWDVGSGLPIRPVMTDEELLTLVQDGLIDVGSHSHTHPNLRTLPPTQVREQVQESKRVLEQLLGTRVDMFAYPYGGFENFSCETRRVLQDVGYAVAVTTIWGTCHSPCELLELPRLYLTEQDRGARIARKVTGVGDWRRIRQSAGHVLRKVRQSLGTSLDRRN